MIVYLKGELIRKEPSRIIVEAGGVGYEVFVPLSTYDRLPAAGDKTLVWIHHDVREDDEVLYGFATEQERDTFELVTTVSGVGPKLALAVLSGLTIGDLQLAISQGDAKRLATVKGIGKKTAERIVIELRDKVNPIEALASGAAGGDRNKANMLRDAMMALTALGFGEEVARRQVKEALDSNEGVSSTEELIKLALQR